MGRLRPNGIIDFMELHFIRSRRWRNWPHPRPQLRGKSRQRPKLAYSTSASAKDEVDADPPQQLNGACYDLFGPREEEE